MQVYEAREKQAHKQRDWLAGWRERDFDRCMPSICVYLPQSLGFVPFECETLETFGPKARLCVENIDLFCSIGYGRERAIIGTRRR
jgi:hypothetical protein